MKTKKTPDLQQAGTPKTKKLARAILAELGNDREALALVLRAVRLLKARSRRSN